MTAAPTNRKLGSAGTDQWPGAACGGAGPAAGRHRLGSGKGPGTRYPPGNFSSRWGRRDFPLKGWSSRWGSGGAALPARARGGRCCAAVCRSGVRGAVTLLGRIPSPGAGWNGAVLRSDSGRVTAGELRGSGLARSALPRCQEPGQLWRRGGGSQKFTHWQATSRCQQQHSVACIAELLEILHLGEVMQKLYFLLLFIQRLIHLHPCVTNLCSCHSQNETAAQRD